MCCYGNVEKMAPTNALDLLSVAYLWLHIKKIIAISSRKIDKI